MRIHRNTVILLLSYAALALFALSFITYLEWPGITNTDYDYDVAKVRAGKLHYWRSYLHSIYIALGYFFNYSRSGYLLLQITCISLLFGWIFSSLHKYAPRLTFITGFVILIWPINQLFSVFLIRDILTSWITVAACIKLFEILISHRKPYSFLILNSSLIILRPENIVMGFIGFIIVLWHYRRDLASIKKIFATQMLGLLFFFLILPLCIGAELHRIKPFASGREKYAYEAVSLIGPVKERVSTMTASELENVDWKTLELFLPKDIWLGNTKPLQAHTLKLADIASEDAWHDFNKESYRIIFSDPLIFLKNRLEMLKHASGFGSETYYLHGDSPLSSFSLKLLALPKWLLASLLLPFLLTALCWSKYKKYPYSGLILAYSWSRLLPIFLLQPAPHFSYSYSIFLFGFFILLLMKIESVYWKTVV